MKVNVKLKAVSQQVIVITGGSSGIGLTTARQAIERGARVVISSNNERELEEAHQWLKNEGGQVERFTADVSDFAQVRALADFTLKRFGTFDTWVNNAGIHLFGKIEDTSERDMRRLFDVNYWGGVHGCRAALPHLRESGGALINIGSVLSSRSVPLQGVYGATKHAMQGYSDVLRMELEKEGAPVSLTVIQPPAISTPIPKHSRNLMKEKARLPAPLYDPDLAARAILFCAEHPRRSLIVGTAGKISVLGEKFVPSLTDKVMETAVWRMQKTKGKPRTEDELHRPMSTRAMRRGDHDFHVARSSIYDSILIHPVAGAGALLAAAGTVTWLLRRNS